MPFVKAEQNRSEDTAHSRRFSGLRCFFLLLFVALQARNGDAKNEVPTWSAFKELLAAEAFEPDSVIVLHDHVEIILKADFDPGKAFSISKKPGESAKAFVAIDSENRQFFIEQLDELQTDYRIDTAVSPWGTILLSWLPMILLIAFIWFLLSRTRQTFGCGAGGDDGPIRQISASHGIQGYDQRHPG